MPSKDAQIVALLLEGRSNAEIGQQLQIKTRTVKDRLNRLYRRYQIRTGIRRVKLAVMLYRKQLEAEDARAERESIR